MPCTWFQDLKKRIRRVIERKKQPVYDVRVDVVNCGQVGGGVIFVWENGKWRRRATWGLRRGRCCAPARLRLPRGEFLIRANCGPPLRIRVPSERRVSVVAAGCYGCTDCLYTTLSKVGIVHIRTERQGVLVGVDSRTYSYAPVNGWITIFMDPGRHKIYTNTGREVEITVRRGHEEVLTI